MELSLQHVGFKSYSIQFCHIDSILLQHIRLADCNNLLTLWQHFFFFLCGHCRILEGNHESFVETVPFKVIASFTIFQILYLLMCFGITWIPIAGILFPIPFFVMIFIRQNVLPRFFSAHDLQELDAAEYEEIVGATNREIPPILRVSHFLSFMLYKSSS